MNNETINEKEVYSVRPAPTELAQQIYEFINANIPEAFNYDSEEEWAREHLLGFEDWQKQRKTEEGRKEWIEENLLQMRPDKWIDFINKASADNPELKDKADEIILEINKYEKRIPELNQFPIDAVFTLDYMNSPDRENEKYLTAEDTLLNNMRSYLTTQEKDELPGLYYDAIMANKSSIPKFAILQLREEAEFKDMRFKGLIDIVRGYNGPDADNYEIIYIRNLNKRVETEADRMRLNQSIFNEFNSDLPRPRDYYGYSLSVGDIIVMYDSSQNWHAYFTDRIDFIRLPYDFLNSSIKTKIQGNINIRAESSLYEEIKQFENEHDISILDTASEERLSQIKNDYSSIFEMADIRAAQEDMDKLGFERDYDNPFSDMFITWKKKDETDSGKTLSFDGWESVNLFVNNVRWLIFNYPITKLIARKNGDYSVIEYSDCTDTELDAAIDTFGFNNEQLEQINKGMLSGLTDEQIGVYAQPVFDYQKMRKMRLGYKYGLTKEEVELYANPFFSLNQMSQVMSGFLSGLAKEQIETYADPEFDWEQMNEIYEGYIHGLDKEKVMLYADSEFDWRQMWQIRAGLEHGLIKKQVETYAKPDFAWRQMDEIRLGFEGGLTAIKVNMYADSEFGYKQMEQIRYGFERGLTMEQVKLYADPDLNYTDMQKYMEELMEINFNINPPGKTLNESDMKEYGYTCERMFPLTLKEAAAHMKDLTIYALYHDGSEAEIKDVTDMTEHAGKDGIFGVDKEDWINYKFKKEIQLIQAVNNNKNKDINADICM